MKPNIPKTRAAIAAALLCIAASALCSDQPPVRVPAPPPEALKLNPFYKKYLDVGGLPVVGSEKVPDQALQRAAELVERMLAKRADVRKKLIEQRVLIAVMAKSEVTTDIPEHRDLTPKDYWDRRARGLGATTARPACTCAEENLLGYKDDRYLGEDILMHEFAHTIHEMGLNRLDASFDARLKKLHKHALEKGLWKNTYAATNHKEYWAEGVQSWFDCNAWSARPNKVHNDVDTREKLERYDPEFAALISEAFRADTWRWNPIGAHAGKREQRAQGGSGVPVRQALADDKPDKLEKDGTAFLQVSGVYPHLAMFNGRGECGIGAIMPWAGKLWAITYPPHETKGGPDKLYEIDEKLNQVIRPESVGGTHACRLIHRESKQLFIGPYAIDAEGKVRALDLKKLAGRQTAVARHLSDPANMVYYFDMEGAIYEVNVHTLDVKKLFDKPVPGWHGKGGYTSQGRLVIANNGGLTVGSKKFEWLAEEPPKSPEDAGVLAEWDGKTWRIIERRQFTDVTGPGGINGAPSDESPLWSMGWDKRSVILKLLDGKQWQTFRLPKASHCFDPRHGWYTEWPRIREAAPGKLLMVMHGMMYEFPAAFSSANTAGIAPLCSHLRYVTDFCDWNGRLAISSDDTSAMKNPMAGQSQSNIWFGDYAALKDFGPRAGWGGPWLEDSVKAGKYSQAYLINGFDRRIAHLAHDGAADVNFTFEIDARGDGKWAEYKSVTVAPRGYSFHIFTADFSAQWIRIKTDKDCKATAYFHYSDARGVPPGGEVIFKALAEAGHADTTVCAGLIRPAAHNRNLQWVLQRQGSGAAVAPKERYYEVDEKLAFTDLSKPSESRAGEVKKLCELKADFEVDEASVIMTLKKENEKDKRYRLPKGAAVFDKPYATGWPRGIREVASERLLANIHGTFYEIPRDDGLPLIKPVCSHSKQIMDFCTWRGLLVLSGTRTDAKPDGQYFGSDGTGLWFGSIDDLWKLGKPRGKGGPWLQTPVKPGEPSDPYLMTGYDKKQVQLAHDSAEAVEFTIEVDFDHHQWVRYDVFKVSAGQSIAYTFPEGYSAHWVRFTVDKPCKATAQFKYW